MLYDGECPLCRREIAWLARRNAGGRLALEDISDPRFDPRRYGITKRAAMERIHGVLPDGRVIHGMEVFRRTDAAVGLGWLLTPPSAVPGSFPPRTDREAILSPSWITPNGVGSRSRASRPRASGRAREHRGRGTPGEARNG